MNKRIFGLIAVCLCISMAHAQVTTKLDMHLWQRLNAGKFNGQNVHLIVKGDTVKLKELTARLGGVFKYSLNNIASVEIPEKNVIAFSNDVAAQKIENTSVKGVFLMDSARVKNNIDKVLNGDAPLTGPLTGKNVVMGIIDGGIDWHNLDFEDTTLNNPTRIRFIWDQSATGNAPLGYSYGNECNASDINSGSCAHLEQLGDFGHGTCVAGIAAGNNQSNKGTPYHLSGVAPETDIVVVKVNTDNNFLSNIVDAVNYIFQVADAMGRPCVINTSVGTYAGSHDGDDLTTHLIEGLLDQKKGRVLVAAAGNGGDIAHHLSYEIPTDSSNAAYTFFNYNSNIAEVAFDLWVDTAKFNKVHFTVGCNDATGLDLGRIQYLNVPIDFHPVPGTSTANAYTLDNGGYLGTVNVQTTLDNGRYHVEFIIGPASTDNLWRLQTYSDEPRDSFDLWASSNSALGFNNSDIVTCLVVNDTTCAPIFFPNYQLPDTKKTLVSYWQCSDKIITVGNYSNRARYIDAEGLAHTIDLTAPPYNEVVGKRFSTSSLGPTRDNRVKPDIIATGSTIICTGDQGTITSFLGDPGNIIKVFITQKDIRNGGTSMASPIVAGICALYLQNRPTATYDEIKTALICTAKTDSFTGTVPNAEYGNGKVDAFRAITQTSCITFGAKDTACINYNSSANVDSGGCVAKVYGCLDSTSASYNPAANISDGNCLPSSIKNLDNSRITLQVVPNPFSNQTTFSLINDGVSFEKAEINILNQLGQVADVIPVNRITTQYVYKNTKLAKGVYFYRLQLDGKTTKAGKLVIE